MRWMKSESTTGLSRWMRLNPVTNRWQINGKYLGSIAHVTEFSFSGKPLESTSGGVMTTNDREIYERAMLAGTHPSRLHRAINVDLCGPNEDGLGLQWVQLDLEAVYSIDEIIIWHYWPDGRTYHETKTAPEWRCNSRAK